VREEIFMLELFILKSCPYCKKVINFLNENNIQFNSFDTADNENALRLLNLGGKDQVPFLYDSNSGKGMYESMDIIEYLKQYIKG